MPSLFPREPLVERHRPARKGLRLRRDDCLLIQVVVERHRPARKGLRPHY